MRLWDYVLGRRLASAEEEEHKVGVMEGIPMLGLDALSSAAYGPEAALTLLLPLGAAGPRYIGPLTLIILALLAVLYVSYRQTISAYPTGGGSYTVAKENLGVRLGLLAAAALLLDYVLNVAVGISAGVGALVSAIPSLNPDILPLCLGILTLITLINLRGVKESGLAFALPTYLFVATLGSTLAMGLYKALISAGHPAAVVCPAPLIHATAAVSLWLLLRAFASGCTAMTGVEAVSNGVTVFAEPAPERAKRTLGLIVLILALLLGGIAYLCHAYGIGATNPDSPAYQSVISQIAGAVVGRGVFYYITLGSVLAVLSLSANTSFADFPRLCRLIAEDDFLPHAFANRGRRLVYTIGIVILFALSGLLLILFGGITDRLIPLFAVGAFLAFTLSQAGMVLHWKRERGRHSQGSLAINAVGAIVTGAALAVILVAKFVEGAWVTVLLIPGMLYVFYKVKRHYLHTEQEIACPRPLELSGIKPPTVIVPVIGWNTVTEKALRFALHLSQEIVAVHISTGETDEQELRRQWAEYVEPAFAEAGFENPHLYIVHSPYRQLVAPLVRFVLQFQRDHPQEQIAVLIPELVEPHWYQYLLHNQAAAVLKAALYLHGNRRLVVINVPWYLRPETGTLPGADVSRRSRRRQPATQPPGASRLRPLRK